MRESGYRGRMGPLRQAYAWASRADSFLGVIERLVAVGGAAAAAASLIATIVGGDLLRFIGVAMILAWLAMIALLLVRRRWGLRLRRQPTGVLVPREIRSQPIAGAEVGEYGEAGVYSTPKPGYDVPIHYRGRMDLWISGLQTEPRRTVYSTPERARALVDSRLWAYGEMPADKELDRPQGRHELANVGGTSVTCMCGWRGTGLDFQRHQAEGNR
jgi:hypothetical protein